MGGVTVVSSFGKSGAAEYGYRFMDTFAKHWPKDVDLIIYREGQETHPRAKMRDLMTVPDCLEFITSHKDDPLANGRLRPDELSPECWRNKDRAAGYSFRTDAVKFCRKVFAVADAAERMRSGILVWIDADVVTLADVASDFIERMLGGQDVAYLGREGCHSECGFLAFRLPEALPLIRRWARFYKTDEVFFLHEWHDSMVFDVARGLTPEVACRDMTPGGTGHTWVSSPLADVMDHLKGLRKQLGRSPEMDRRQVNLDGSVTVLPPPPIPKPKKPPTEPDPNRITWAKVREIRARAMAGESRRSIADSFGLTKKHTAMIILEKTWPSGSEPKRSEDSQQPVLI